jgi:circadian clock protein KaiB
MNAAETFTFSLYVAGDAQNSAQATSNLNKLCRASLPGQHSIEIVDVLKDPKRALADGVFMTPTLIKHRPLPLRRIVGTLSQTAVVMQALGLHALAE